MWFGNKKQEEKKQEEKKEVKPYSLSVEFSNGNKEQYDNVIKSSLWGSHIEITLSNKKMIHLSLHTINYVKEL